MCSVQKWTPRTGAPKLNHWDGGQNMFNNTVEADQLATIVFFVDLLCGFQHVLLCCCMGNGWGRCELYYIVYI